MSAMGASFGNSYVCTLSEAVWLNRRSDTLDHLDLNHGVCISNSLQLKYLKGRFWPRVCKNAFVNPCYDF